jgi:glycosyltransferase involved in cell wall biosynthesis
MAVYNEENTVRLAIDSILGQTLADFEFIVIDDGSTDNTIDILTMYGRRDDRINIIRQNNCGLTSALNRGLATATGRFVARQDGNDISLPHRLSCQTAFLERNPSFVLVGSDVDLIDDDGKFLVTIKNSQIKNIAQKLRKTNPFYHGAIMFRRIVNGDAIRYNEYYQMAQDYDLACRLVEMGKVIILPDVLYRCRFSRKGIVATNVTFYGERARENYLRRASGLAEDFSAPNIDQITPKYDKWRFTFSIAIRYLSGYETEKARESFIKVSREVPFMSREYFHCLKYIVISFLPHRVIRKIREG